MDSFWFPLGCVVLWFSQVLDAISTSVGIWNHGLTEGNPIYKKLLPTKVYKYLFNTAEGVFAGCTVTLALVVTYFEVCTHFGFADNKHAWLAFVLAGGPLAMFVRNLLLSRKTPILVGKVGQI